MKLKNRTAIVTGAANGVGRAVVKLFSNQGAKVVIADIDQLNGEKVMQEIKDKGGEALFIRTDIGLLTDIKKLVNKTIKSYEKIDILVNNAGFIQNKSLEEITVSDWDRMLNVNLRSVFFLTQAVMNNMKNNRYGRVINMASQAGKTGGLNTGAHYAVSKAGILCLMKSFAKNLSKFGVTVNCVSPGVVDTDLPKSVPDIGGIINTIPLGRAATTEEIAKAVIFLASEDASYITGECLDVNGGLLMD